MTTDAQDPREWTTTAGPTDDKGRPAVNTMTDRALQEETLVLLRTLIDVLEQIGSNPMMRAMMPGMNV